MPCSFDGANFRQDKEKGAENTLCIVKPFDAELAEIGPSKPCSNWHHQAKAEAAEQAKADTAQRDQEKPEKPGEDSRKTRHLVKQMDLIRRYRAYRPGGLGKRRQPFS